MAHANASRVTWIFSPYCQCKKVWKMEYVDYHPNYESEIPAYIDKYLDLCNSTLYVKSQSHDAEWISSPSRHTSRSSESIHTFSLLSSSNHCIRHYRSYIETLLSYGKDAKKNRSYLLIFTLKMTLANLTT